MKLNLKKLIEPKTATTITLYASVMEEIREISEIEGWAMQKVFASAINTFISEYRDSAETRGFSEEFDTEQEYILARGEKFRLELDAKLQREEDEDREQRERFDGPNRFRCPTIPTDADGFVVEGYEDEWDGSEPGCDQDGNSPREDDVEWCSTCREYHTAEEIEEGCHDYPCHYERNCNDK